MKKPIEPRLLEKFLSGSCTDHEEKIINEWYESFDTQPDVVSAMSDAQRKILKSRIRNAIKTNRDSEAGRKPGRLIRYFSYSVTGIAASLLVFFLLLPKSKQVIIVPQAPELVVLKNTTHGLSEHTLGDGTKVWLSPGAQLSFNKIFRGPYRNVNLTGECFFEVTKNPARPFVVYSGNLVTKVWGTSFRVRDSKSLSFADVTVVTGKISVKLAHPGTLVVNNARSLNRDTEVMIYPQQNVTYNKSDHIFRSTTKANMKDLHIWRKTTLSFDNKQMMEVLPVLSREFDVDITTNDASINQYLLSADFEGLNLPQVLEIMHTTFNITYEIHGRDVRLNPVN